MAIGPDRTFPISCCTRELARQARPLRTRDGHTLPTLSDARAYALALPDGLRSGRYGKVGPES